MATLQQSLQQIKDNILHVYPNPEAGAIAQIVIEHTLQMTRLQVNLNKQQELTIKQQDKINHIISRLQQHEPIQYIIGSTHFYDLELFVDERVLIPRPETEELVDLVIKAYKHQKGLQILDICTGSGCIPVALASNLIESKVYGVDVSAAALDVARTNAEKYNLQIQWLDQDIFNDLPLPKQAFDIITSNPPYVLEEEKEQMRSNVLNFEPHLALFVPDSDPLKFYKRISFVGSQLLKKAGTLYFEINERYGDDVCQVLLEAGFRQAIVVQDLFNKDRIVRAIL